MHSPEVWGITFYRGKIGQNSNCPSCGVLYGEQKSPKEGGSISPPAGDIGAPLPWSWVKNGAQKSIRKSGISTVFEVGRCGGSLESWVLVYTPFWSHYHMYRNGTLTFGPSSWGTRDLGTRNLVTLAKMAHIVGKTTHCGQSDPISGSQISGTPWGGAKC